jgi:imidazolonepropionase-like amidohydrolase
MSLTPNSLRINSCPIVVLVFGIIAAGSAGAQDHPGEQGFRVRSLALVGGRIVTAPGEVIDRGTVLLRDNRIVSVGADVALPPDAERLAIDGLTVYAGFIDAGNTALLDPDAKLPTVEARPVDVSKFALAGLRPDEHRGLTPQFRAAQALKLSSAELDKHRQAGLCTVHVVPTGRIASGQTAVVHLSGQPPRESVVRDGDMIALQLLDRLSGGEYPATLMGIHAHLRQTFLDAERLMKQRELHAQGVAGVERPPHDPVWEEFAALRRGERKALFYVDDRDDIERALRMAKEQQLKPVLWGLHELGNWRDALRDGRIDTVVTLDFGDAPKLDAPEQKGDFPEIAAPLRVRQWRRERWQERVGVMKELHQAGLRFGIATAGLKSPEELPKAIRQTISEGLSRDVALAALTTQPAQALGIDRDVGRVAPGLLANLVVLTGPFDHDQAKVRYVFVEGRKFEYNRESKPVSDDKPSQPPISVAGRWQLEIQAGDEKLPGTLELVQTGARLAGRFTSGQGDGSVSSGQVGSDAVKFDVSIGAGDRAIVLKFQGKLEADRIEGSLKSPFGPSTAWSARREATPPATANPIQLASIETTADDGPVSALAAPKISDDLPTELPADRTARLLRTGGNVLIRGGTVLTGTGATLPKHSILVKNGLIAAIAADLQPEPGMTVIDAAGRYIMPGIIDTHSHIMLSSGLGGVNEATHSIVCEVRTSDVLNTQDGGEYRALAGGVTTVRLLHGSANVVGGQDAVVQLKHGASAAEHLFAGAHPGVKFALGENVKFRQGRFPNTRLGVEATLQRAFVEALEYRHEWQEYERAAKQAGDQATQILPPRRDLRLEALAEIVSQERFIHSHCYRSDEILMLLRVAQSLGIRVWSLQHVLEGYKVAPEIVAHGASCSTFSDWWAYKVEAYDAVPHNAALLHEAGANVVIKSDDAELMRHLYLEMQKPVRYGNLSPDVAISLVTLHPARELGLAERVGSIEVGKQADLAIFNAHPLNSFARCEWTLIAGEQYFIREKQPTVMSAAAQSRTATLPDWSPLRPDQRRPLVDLSPAAAGKVALVGATVHPVDAPDIPAGTVLVEQGRIAAVSAGEVAPEGWPVVRLDGLHVYPGLIDSGTTVGLTEIGKVLETHDSAEIGLFQPDLRAAVAVNPDSELIPVARAGGITAALIRPNGGVICGQASVIQLAGWTAPEMAVLEEAGLQINWPGARSNKEQIEQLREWLRAARVYDQARSANPDAGGLTRLVDPRYEALRPYVRGEKTVFIQADSQQQMHEALRFAEQEKLKLVIASAGAAWKLAPLLKEKNIPVIVGAVMRKPVEDHDPFDALYANAGRLHEAGVRFAIRSDNPANSRNTPFEAAMAVAYGLPEDAALRAITLSAADILGLGDRCGSLTVGKRADLVILDGSPLQITSQVKGVMVAGKPFAPTSRQTDLYEKYRQRLHEVQAQRAGTVAGP